MGHATVDNNSPFAVQQSFAVDEAGRTLAVILVHGTYGISPGRPLVLAEVQSPPSLAGEAWGDDPATGGFRIEPAFAFVKQATDVVLAGHAQSPSGPVRTLNVTFRVGALTRTLHVSGDRVWAKTVQGASPTRPAPFTSMPLSYAKAFGGWDRSTPGKERSEPRNPIGLGFRASSRFEDNLALPNIEDPDDLLTELGQIVTPAGVGFISPDWEPRASFAGTYDEAWSSDRMPFLPADFDRAFFSAASPGLVSRSFLKGDEPVLIEGASAHGRLAFKLPGGLPLESLVSSHGARDAAVPLSLDTVVIDTDRDQVMLTWRGSTPLRNGPHDLKSVVVRTAAHTVA